MKRAATLTVVIGSAARPMNEKRPKNADIRMYDFLWYPKSGYLHVDVRCVSVRITHKHMSLPEYRVQNQTNEVAYESERTPKTPLMDHGVDPIADMVWHALPSTWRVFLQYESLTSPKVDMSRPLTHTYMMPIWIANRHPKLCWRRSVKFENMRTGCIA